MYNSRTDREFEAGSQGGASNNGRVAGWLATLEAIRRDDRLSETSAQQAMLRSGAAQDTTGTGSDDELDVDLAKSALETGTAAFDAQDWDEAESLLQEALEVLHQLSRRQRALCDIYALQYRLAVCAYHTQKTDDAEQALISLFQQPVSSDLHREYMYDAAHLLSYLYIRTGRVDLARSECERTLQGRRRLLGKHSEASLFSTALMAHIYLLLNNGARAKACLAMIPEERRDEFTSTVQASLDTNVNNFDSKTNLMRTVSEEPGVTRKPVPKRSSGSYGTPSMDNRCYRPIPAVIPQAEDLSPRQLYQRSQSNGSGLDSVSSLTVASISSAEQRSTSSSMERARTHEDYFRGDPFQSSTSVGASEAPRASAISRSTGLSRGEILRNLRCTPVDRIEEAVCNSNPVALASLLKKKNGFLRSKVQKALHSKRVTALHYAALFGEIDMARRLLNANYEINEVPDLSTTRITPLKMAIGARQVEMVEFLIAKGAQPIEPDTWSTLIGQLMSRSWIADTTSVADKEDLDYIPNRIIAILNIWLRHGFNVNAPYDVSGRTLLHQAVAFESGSYKWDANLRVAITRFLCAQGADPTKPDAKGNTPYDMAAIIEDRDLLLVLEQRLRGERVEVPPEVAELASASSPVELSDDSPTKFFELPGQSFTVDKRPLRYPGD